MATSIDADSANDVAAAKFVAGYVDTTAVTDAKDAGATESVTRVWAPSSAEDVAVTAAEGVAASVDSAVVKISEGAGSSKDFARVLAPCPVSFLFFFGHIVFIQCHQYWSSSYQFTVLIKIAFHKEGRRIQNRVTSISLQSITPVNNTYKTSNQVKQDKKMTSKDAKGLLMVHVVVYWLFVSSIVVHYYYFIWY
eukprot:scaffold39404_cov36-Attheya_sp.AAC.3